MTNRKIYRHLVHGNKDSKQKRNHSVEAMLTYFSLPVLQKMYLCILNEQYAAQRIIYKYLQHYIHRSITRIAS